MNDDAKATTTTTLMNRTSDRGTKRAADDTLDDEQRFAKRFNLLNLIDRDGSKLYIPVPTSSNAQNKSNETRDEHMQVDDTKDRVYIHDLEEELAEIESDEEKLIFLPDIEKKLSKIPKHILRGSKSDTTEGQELVLYNVPSSLTVPEEQDIVRKAIEDARQRARDKVARNAHLNDHAETAHGFGADEYIEEDKPEDADAMDIG